MPAKTHPPANVLAGDLFLTRCDLESGDWKQEVTLNKDTGQIIIFHQPRFPWNKGISLTKLPFGVRSCEVAIIWPEG